MAITKQIALSHIKALYVVFNASDSDNLGGRADWTRPEYARTCCSPLDKLLSSMLTKEELEEFYANL